MQSLLLLLLGEHINSNKSSPVPQTRLNSSQQQKAAIKKLIKLFSSQNFVMIVSHAYTNWITGNKLQLFDHFGVNQSIIYSNPTASEHIILALSTLSLFVNVLLLSSTHVILNCKRKQGMYFSLISIYSSLITRLELGKLIHRSDEVSLLYYFNFWC